MSHLAGHRARSRSIDGFRVENDARLTRYGQRRRVFTQPGPIPEASSILNRLNFRLLSYRYRVRGYTAAIAVARGMPVFLAFGVGPIKCRPDRYPIRRERQNPEPLTGKVGTNLQKTPIRKIERNR